ncbi:peptide deformylase, partial [Nocardia sp. NPDC058497]|uniref:peptide deformylase n=1 Tax=Nocardia sp. NPDC058497 TaxID=3346529 RepID=UPI0036562596
MAILPIVIVGDPVLHNPTAPVTETPAELADLIADMYDTLEESKGVGLAANQVGVGKRLFVYDCPDFDAAGQQIRRKGVVINPVLETSAIPETMPDPDDDEEGCLSVPGEQFPTGRADWARVTGTDEKGEPVDIEGTGFFARMLQHEVGHRAGVRSGEVL